MKVMPRSAAYRMAFAVSLAFAAATLIMGIIIYFAAHAAFAREMDANIAQGANDVMAEYRDDGIGGLQEAIQQHEGRGTDALGYALFDPAGRRIGGSLNMTMPAEGWHKISFLDPVEGPDPARALTSLLPQGYRLVVAADLEPLDNIDHTILSLFAIAFGAVLILGLVGALAFGSYLRRRLARIEATAEAIVAGDLSRRMKLGPHHDEFDRVGASLNVMLDRIAGLIASLRQVTSDLAHDLRTPLARLRNQLERLQADAEAGRPRDAVEKAVEQADEVLRLFDAILRISELEEGSLRRGFAKVDLCKLVRELGEAHAPLAEDAGKTLVAKVYGDCFVDGDRELIAQAMINLIENALRHTPPGTAIEIGACKAFGEVTAYVSDTGPGIPEAEHERVLERFVRLHEARTTPGHGLGLSLVRAIAEAHDVTISMTRRDRFKVALHFPQTKLR
jgi:signal transduction histidine kinase